MKSSLARPSVAAEPQVSSLLRPQAWLLAAAIACGVARVLIPSESAIDDGAGMTFALAWLVVAAAAAFCGWRTGYPAWRLTAFDGALLAFAAWFLLSGVVAMRHGTPRAAMNGAWLWSSFSLSIVALRRLIRTEQERRATVAVMAALACALGTLGIEQFAIELPETRRVYFADPDAALRAQGLWYEPGSRERTLFEERLKSTEPFATFALTNSLAGFLAPWLTVGALCAWRARQIDPHKTWGWAGPLLTCIPIAVCLLLTKSRSAWLAVIAGATVAFVWNARSAVVVRWRWLAGGAGAVLLAFVTAWGLGVIDDEVFTEAGKSLGYRGQYWQSTARMIADHPLFGVGPGQFQEYYTAYKLRVASEVVADPHNLFFEVAATAGLPALVLFIAFFPLAWREASVSEADASPFGNADGRDHPDGADASVWVLGGGIVGFLLAWPLSWLGQTGPSVSAFTFGLPAMLIALGLWHVWGRHGRLESRAIVIALLVLCVNLLAAGGIGIPGVAGTFALLLAVWSGAPAVSATRGRWPAAAVAGGCAVLAATCYMTAYRPVVLAQIARQQAIDDPRRAEQHLLEAIEADPYAAQPWRDLASWRFARWQRNPTPENWQATTEAIDHGLRLSPRSAVAWKQAGESRWSAYQQLKEDVLLKSAVDAFRAAVRLYPNQAENRAALAEVLSMAGESDSAKSEATKALELDHATPHLDQKLTGERRAQVTKIAGS